MALQYAQTDFTINVFQPQDPIPPEAPNFVNVAAGTPFNGSVSLKLPAGSHAVGSWWSVPTWDANWQGSIVHLKMDNFNGTGLPIAFDTNAQARARIRVRAHVMFVTA